MNKKDVKDGIKAIKLAVKEFQDNYQEELQPLEDLREHVEAINGICEEKGIDLEMDWEEMGGKAIRELIANSEYFPSIEEQIDNLASDLEYWSEEVSETKCEQIQEKYIQPLEDIKEYLDVDNIECVEDIENMINDLENGLEEFFNN